MPKVDWEDAQSSSDVHPCLGNSSFISWDRLNRPFFCSHNCSQVAVDSTKTPPDLLKAFAIQVHESAFLRIRHDNDFRHFRFPFWLQPPSCRIYTEPILHQNQEKEEPSSRSHQKLFRPGTLIPLSAFFSSNLLLSFPTQARKLFFALCPPKISSVLHFFFFFLCFLFHFFSCRFFWTRHLLTGASRVLGSFLWLFIW